MLHKGCAGEEVGKTKLVRERKGKPDFSFFNASRGRNGRELKSVQKKELYNNGKTGGRVRQTSICVIVL